MTDKLKPCPFCGATPHKGLSKIKHDQLHGEPYQDVIIKCPHLCASMEGSAERVLDRWNARADSPALLAAEELAAEVQEYATHKKNGAPHNPRNPKVFAALAAYRAATGGAA